MAANLKHAEALRWLDDRCGQLVSASVTVERGGSSLTVLQATGELRRWHGLDRGSNQRWLEVALTNRREDDVGVYQVGEASLDVSDIPGHTITSTTQDMGPGGVGEVLKLELGEGIELEIIRPELQLNEVGA